jgi:IS605 OrfB family transposase
MTFAFDRILPVEAIRTVVSKLAPTAEQRAEIDATLGAFARACDFAADVAREIGSTNKVKVHHAGYYQIRETFGLAANLVVRAIARACIALKVPEKMHSAFEPTSVDYDARIFSFREWDWTFSLTLLTARTRIKTHLGDRQRAMLTGRKPTAAVLVKRRDGAIFLHVQLTDPARSPIDTLDVIGVDFGIKNLAVTDDGETFSGDGVEAVRRRYNRHRRLLQKAGTKSATRRLQKIRMRESGFKRQTNHVISTRLIARAKGTASSIALEDLEGIGKRTTARKGQRSRMQGWTFYQLRSFLAYKALGAGVPLILVDPAYTSQLCSACGYTARANRRSRDAFQCRHCGFALGADVNAARNIRARAAVNRPIVGIVDAGPRNPAEIAYKLPALAGSS